MTSISTPRDAYTPEARIERGATAQSATTSPSAAVLALLIVVAIALRAWGYLSNVSLWLDELLVSRNILGLPLSHLLTKPLLQDFTEPQRSPRSREWQQR
jgi:hypothetical protein